MAQIEIAYLMGSIGGILFLVHWTVTSIIRFIKWFKKYQKMKTYYEKNNRPRNQKIPMGFKTESEKREIENRLNKDAS